MVVLEEENKEQSSDGNDAVNRNRVVNPVRPSFPRIRFPATSPFERVLNSVRAPFQWRNANFRRLPSPMVSLNNVTPIQRTNADVAGLPSPMASMNNVRQNLLSYLSERGNRVSRGGVQPNTGGASSMPESSTNPQSANTANRTARKRIRFSQLNAPRSSSLPEGLDSYERTISRERTIAYAPAFRLRQLRLAQGEERVMVESRENLRQSASSNIEVTDHQRSERGRPVTEGPRARRGRPFREDQGAQRGRPSTRVTISQPGTSAGGGPISQPGTSAGGGPISQPGTSTGGDPPSQRGRSDRGGSRPQRSMSAEPPLQAISDSRPLNLPDQSLLDPDIPVFQYIPDRFRGDLLTFSQACGVMRYFDLDTYYGLIRTTLIHFSLRIFGLDDCPTRDLMLAVFLFIEQYFEIQPEIEVCVRPIPNNDDDASAVGVVFQRMSLPVDIWNKRSVLKDTNYKLKFNFDISWIINSCDY